MNFLLQLVFEYSPAFASPSGLRNPWCMTSRRSWRECNLRVGAKDPEGCQSLSPVRGNDVALITSSHKRFSKGR